MMQLSDVLLNIATGILHHISSALSPAALLCSLSLLLLELLPSLGPRPPPRHTLVRDQTT